MKPNHICSGEKNNIVPQGNTLHCLAMGTNITLSDGTKRSIENIKKGDKIVVNSIGKTLPVRLITYAVHSGFVIRITTSGCDQLTLSEGHVVITPQGPKSADELKKGDTIISRFGNTAVLSVKKIDFYGHLLNLLLGDFDQIEYLDDFATTMFANNILVGDHQVQTKYLELKIACENNILTTIGSDWQDNFCSNIEKMLS